MKYILISILLLIYSFGQSQELETLKEIQIEKITNDKLILNNDLEISIGSDSAKTFDILKFYKNSIIKLTDSIDFTTEGFNYRFLKLKNGKGYVLIIESIYEFLSDYPVYTIQKNEIKKIGNLNIMLDCPNCDVYNYPINEIIVKADKEKIEFSFSKDIVLNDKKDYPKFKNSDIKYIYRFGENKLELKKHRC